MMCDAPAIVVVQQCGPNSETVSQLENSNSRSHNVLSMEVFIISALTWSLGDFSDKFTI